MGSEWHDEAKDYVDNMIIRPAGYDPDLLPSPTPYLIKQISLNYAMERYALSRMRQVGDFWEQQYNAVRDNRIGLERRVNVTIFYEYIEEDDKGRQGGATARLYRV